MYPVKGFTRGKEEQGVIGTKRNPFYEGSIHEVTNPPFDPPLLFGAAGG